MVFDPLTDLSCPNQNPTALFYFLSTLAQCAAAFVALTGLFAVFRFQANGPEVEERYTAAKSWLSTHASACIERERRIKLSNKEIMQSLLDIRAGKQYQQLKDNAELPKLIEGIKTAEEANKRMANYASRPMKLWGYIFFFSILVLPFSSGYAVSPVIVISGFCVATVFALLKTKEFIQKCMEFK